VRALNAAPPAPGQAALVATGCGTALACVCALGLLEIDRRLGGVWSLAAVAMAALLCGALARVLGRLAAVVPSGVGLLAFLARGLGRRRAVLLMVPYLLLVLALVAVEARIVGALLARLVPVPPVVGAVVFLVATWAVARAGVRPGLRAQAVATWILLGGFALLAVAALVRAGADPGLGARLVPAAPSLLAFASGVGQALFLFIGFELVTTQAELVRAPGAIAQALRRSVAVLALFYGLAALAVTTVAPGAAGWTAPQTLLVPAAASPAVAVLVGVLCLLASFTSWNGALLTLSRLVAALAAQGFLPRPLARIDGRRLVPRHALLALLALAAALVVALERPAFLPVVLGAAAASAALVWAAAVAVRERAPFAEPGRPRRHRALAFALAALFVAFGLGAVVEAFPRPQPQPGGAIAHVR
jgi:amino acid transporter